MYFSAETEVSNLASAGTTQAIEICRIRKKLQSIDTRLKPEVEFGY